MAKTKTARKQGTKDARRTRTDPVDLDALIDRYIWLLVPLLVALYYWFGTGSTGFYQDDEIGHYRNMRQFWHDPFSIMGNQPKPGWKILMVLPALLGFRGVAVAHCLVAAVTVVCTYKLGRAMGMRNSVVAALLLAAQPLYLQLAFRSYSEIAAGLFIVLMLWAYYRERYVLAAIASSYVFSIRQEFALVTIGLGALFLIRRKWIPFLLLGWTPVALALIGWLHTGNPTWLLDDMRRIGLGVTVPHKPFWHYFETYIYIIGPVCLALFVLGYWSFLADPKRWKETLARNGFLFFTFTTMWAWSVFSAWDVPNFGANPGHWRYLLSFSPIAALYATAGLNALLDSERTKYAYLALGLFVLIVALFLSRAANGLTMTDTASYTNLAVVVVLLLFFVLTATARIVPPKALPLLLVALATVTTVATEKPLKLDSEAATAKQAADWYRTQPEAVRERPLYCNHVLVRYFANLDIGDTLRDRMLRKSTLAEAPAGSIVIWDSHYGNSQFGGDVPYEFFKDNPSYRELTQFIAPDQRFGALVFEKEH